MIKSMTGFGKAEINLSKHKLSIEIRALNSKQLDLNTKVPGIYRDKEAKIRNMVAKALERGKVDVFLFVESAEGESQYVVNKTLALHYYEELQALGRTIGHKAGEDIISTLVKMPDVLKAEKEAVDEEEWKTVEDGLNQALEQVDAFRIDEALTLEEDFRKRCSSIMEGLNGIPMHEESRIERIKERIRKALEDLGHSDRVDENRFEQELIYYLEKLDITEEKVRLEKHCSHFLQTLDNPTSEGKKLGFIVQEMGREINTIGSKANEANIQRIVVNMKDELEKIKEQLANIL